MVYGFNFINLRYNKHYQFTVSYKNSSSFVILGAITKPTQITYEEYKQLKKR
jgi:hypothetical protein